MAYRTVEMSSERELVVKRSRFIGRAFPVSGEEQALFLLEKIRKQHWDATHNCFAYSIGEKGTCARYSDDGEPSGTAGQPILEAIRSRGLTDVLVVVTRYFGGTLLGTGGLVRAYGASASEALEAAGPVDMTDCVVYSAEVPYHLWGKVGAYAETAGATAGAVEYGAAVQVEWIVPAEESGRFLKGLRELTSDAVRPAEKERRVLPCRRPGDGRNTPV